MEIIPQSLLVQMKKNLQDAESGLADLSKELQRAHRAGIDVTDLRKRESELKSQIDRLRIAYNL